MATPLKRPLDDTNSVAGPGFRMADSGKKSRGSVGRILSQLSPRGAKPVDHWLVFANEKDLARFNRLRVETTIAKFSTALALAYALQMDAPRLVVGGARDQHLSGDSSHVKKGGQSYLRGIQAAHFAIGTLWRGSESMAREAYCKLLENHASSEVTGGIQNVFPHSSALVKVLLAHDAATYAAPAFINQSDGKIEVVKQHYLLGLMPTTTPKNDVELRRDLTVLNHRLIDFFLNSKINLDPVERRLQQIQNGTAKGYCQDPDDLKQLLLFGGEETQYLEVNQIKLSDSNSDLISNVAAVSHDTQRRVDDVVLLAESSREEQSS